MSPFFGLLVVIWIIRSLLNNPAGSKASGNGIEISPAVIALLAKIVGLSLLSLVVGSYGGFAASGVQLICAMAIIVLFFPSLILYWVLRPMGAYRFSYWLVRISYPFGFGRENRAGAVFHGLLALACQGATPEAINWLTLRQAPRPPPGYVGELNVALFAALTGRRDAAKILFHAIDTHHGVGGPAKFRRLARDYLVMDAARRGDWQEVIYRGGRGRDSYRWSYTVARLAERIDRREGALPLVGLCFLWLISPRRLRLWPLLRQALAVPLHAKKKERPPPVPNDLSLALGMLGDMLVESERNQRMPRRDHCLEIIAQLHSALESPAQRTLLEARLRGLDPLRANQADAILNNFRLQIVAMIVVLLEKWPGLSSPDSECVLIQQAIAQIRHKALQEIDMRCRDYVERTREKIALDLCTEWEAWAGIKHIAKHLVKISPSTKASVFQEMYLPLCNFAVYQHNDLNRYRLAHEQFLWLREHADHPSEIFDLLSQNIRACPQWK